MGNPIRYEMDDSGSRSVALNMNEFKVIEHFSTLLPQFLKAKAIQQFQ